MWMKCTTCGTRISKGWLFLGLPWSKYTCARCGSIFSGTFFRSALISIATGVLGYFLISVIKGKMSPVLLCPTAAVTLILLFFNLPKQIKKIGQVDHSNNIKPK